MQSGVLGDGFAKPSMEQISPIEELRCGRARSASLASGGVLLGVLERVVIRKLFARLVTKGHLHPDMTIAPLVSGGSHTHGYLSPCSMSRKPVWLTPAQRCASVDAGHAAGTFPVSGYILLDITRVDFLE